MRNQFLDQLSALEHTIIATDITLAAKHTDLWSGANVNIFEHMPAQNYDKSHTYVVTSYAKELSWLIGQLEAIFKDDIDHFSQHEFYGNLAEVVNAYLNGNKSPSMTELLLCVANAAKAMVMEE